MGSCTLWQLTTRWHQKVGGAVPGKALVQDHDALGLAVPLPHRDGSRMEAMTAGVVAPRLDFVSVPGSRGDLVEEALGVPVEITNANFWRCNFNGLLPSL
jgi:hypothetical protein